MRAPTLLLAALLIACGAPAVRPTEARGSARSAIDAVLDDWHEAAAHSEEDRYFAHLAEDSIFLGTDATERWNEAAFRAYAHPHFERGRGWVLHPVRRDVVVEDGGRLAWFDEDLESEGLGPARGSGVLRLEPDGQWRIVHYNLAITVPNERFDAVRALLGRSADEDAQVD